MKVAVLLPYRFEARSRRDAVDVARTLERLASERSVEVRVVLGLPDSTRHDAADTTGLRIREFRVRSIEGDRVRRLETIGGWDPHHFPDRGVYFRDGIADFADCDVWLLLASTGVDEDGGAAPILRLRPSVVAPTIPTTDSAAWLDVLERLHEVAHG